MVKTDGQLLSQKVYEQLESAIVRRELPPGSHLIEDEIALRLHVSRTPVREAFRMLAREQWLELHPHVGAYVRHPTLEEVRDLFELRETLDRRATELAVGRSSPKDIATLEKIVARGWKAVEKRDSERIANLNFQFHGTIAQIANNKVFVRILQGIEKQVRWHFTAVALDRREDSWREHELIIEAIRLEEADRAGELISEHNRLTLEAYMSALLAGRV